MIASLTRRQTPEEHELGKKRIQLTTLETELAQRELDLTILHAELRTFESRYLREVGVPYAELDEIEAQIAEAQARLTPQNQQAQEQSSQARAQAQESAQAAGAARQSREQKKFTASESLKKFYRDIAKSLHPDLTTDEADRDRRQRLMAEANQAYADGDEARLQGILREWESSPESVKGEGIGAELIRIIRKIAQVEERLRSIEAETIDLKSSDLYRLKVKVEEAESEGRDLLVELASQMKRQITEAQERLTVIRQKGANS